MSTPAHLQQYRAAIAAFKAASGRRIKGHVFLAIDDRNEIYYGADARTCSRADLLQLQDRIAWARKFLADTLAAAASPLTPHASPRRRRA